MASPYPQGEPMKTALILFNRDLRVHDNPALAAAARAERTLPLFVLDEALLGSRFAAPNRVAFMREALLDLDEALRSGRAGASSCAAATRSRRRWPLARECGAEELHVSADYSAYARAPRAAAGGGLRGGADRLPRPPRDDDRAARRRHPRRRRSLQGLHPLPPRLERAAAAAPGRSAAPARRPQRLRAGRLPALAKLTGGTPSPERARAARARGGGWPAPSSATASAATTSATTTSPATAPRGSAPTCASAASRRWR